MESDFKADSAAIKAYIDQQMTKKLEILKSDVNEMVDNFQLEMVRQFQI